MSKDARALLASVRTDVERITKKEVVSPKTLNERARKEKLKKWNPDDDEDPSSTPHESSVPTSVCVVYFAAGWLVSCLPICEQTRREMGVVLMCCFLCFSLTFFLFLSTPSPHHPLGCSLTFPVHLSLFPLRCQISLQSCLEWERSMRVFLLS